MFRKAAGLVAVAGCAACESRATVAVVAIWRRLQKKRQSTR